MQLVMSNSHHVEKNDAVPVFFINLIKIRLVKFLLYTIQDLAIFFIT